MSISIVARNADEDSATLLFRLQRVWPLKIEVLVGQISRLRVRGRLILIRTTD